jgi:hypothetical protein
MNESKSNYSEDFDSPYKSRKIHLCAFILRSVRNIRCWSIVQWVYFGRIYRCVMRRWLVHSASEHSSCDDQTSRPFLLDVLNFTRQVE